jgi:hypothetical protein
VTFPLFWFSNSFDHHTRNRVLLFFFVYLYLMDTNLREVYFLIKWRLKLMNVSGDARNKPSRPVKPGSLLPQYLKISVSDREYHCLINKCNGIVVEETWRVMKDIMGNLAACKHPGSGFKVFASALKEQDWKNSGTFEAPQFSVTMCCTGSLSQDPRNRPCDLSPMAHFGSLANDESLRAFVHSNRMPNGVITEVLCFLEAALSEVGNLIVRGSYRRGLSLKKSSDLDLDLLVDNDYFSLKLMQERMGYVQSIQRSRSPYGYHRTPPSLTPDSTPHTNFCYKLLLLCKKAAEPGMTPDFEIELQSDPSLPVGNTILPYQFTRSAKLVVRHRGVSIDVDLFPKFHGENGVFGLSPADENNKRVWLPTKMPRCIYFPPTDLEEYVYTAIILLKFWKANLSKKNEYSWFALVKGHHIGMAAERVGARNSEALKELGETGGKTSPPTALHLQTRNIVLWVLEYLLHAYQARVPCDDPMAGTDANENIDVAAGSENAAATGGVAAETNDDSTEKPESFDFVFPDQPVHPVHGKNPFYNDTVDHKNRDDLLRKMEKVHISLWRELFATLGKRQRE